MEKYAPRRDGPGLNPRDALDMLEIRARETRNYLVQNAPVVGDAVLQYLAEEGAPATRQAVAAGIIAPATINRMLADDESEEVRTELAVKVARLMPGLEAREEAHVIALTLETLECLARDTAVKVRAALAEAIKSMDCVPRAVVQKLARDLEGIVAAPVLEYSPLLSDADLIEIIALGQVEEALSAIARRKPLSAQVADAVVQSLDISAIATLLVNPNAKVRRETLERVVEQAEDIQAWHVPLALRTDLSARAMRRVSSFVGANLIEQLAARNDLDASVRAHLARQLRTSLEKKPATGITPEAAKAAVAAACAAGELDDMFVEDATLTGARETVIFALAARANIGEAAVRRILGVGAKPLVALVWHAGLSMRVAFKIQTFIMKLPTRELLPARGGVDFPLTPEEMRWHLNYFGIPA